MTLPTKPRQIFFITWIAEYCLLNFALTLATLARQIGEISDFSVYITHFCI